MAKKEGITPKIISEVEETLDENAVEIIEDVVTPSIKIVNLDLSEANIAYQTSKSAGLDLTSQEDIAIYKGRDPVMLRTGLRLLNTGVENVVGLLTLRSSLRKQGFSILGVGIIDADYEGEIMIPIVYTGSKTGVRLARGERVAQIVLLPFLRFDNQVKDVERDGGFGSTK